MWLRRIGIDWNRYRRCAARVEARVALQGNLDPVATATPAAIEAETLAILDAAGPQPGYIFNRGHGILLSTPPENVAALVACPCASGAWASGCADPIAHWLAPALARVGLQPPEQPPRAPVMHKYDLVIAVQGSVGMWD
jgi:hypothetical protein